MSRSNKDRLWVTLYHRKEQPGYHWAILLTPKHENEDTAAEAYDLDNSALENLDGLGNIPPQGNMWTYRRRRILPIKCRTLIAWIRIAKVPQGSADYIDKVLCKVNIRREDTCRTWILRAMKALRGSFHEIPSDTFKFQLKAVSFADVARRLLLDADAPLVVRASTIRVHVGVASDLPSLPNRA